MIDMLEELLVLEGDRNRRKERIKDTESWKRTMKGKYCNSANKVCHYFTLHASI